MSNNRSKNALKHGLYASGDVVLDWENEQDFKVLHESFREEYCPNGASEEAAVFDLAYLQWRKRRLHIGSQLTFRGHPDAEALADAGRRGWAGVADYLKSTTGDGDRMCDAIRALAKSQAKATEKVCALIAEQTMLMSQEGSSAVPARQESKPADPAKLQGLITLSKELNVMNEMIVPALELIENYDLDQTVCERAYRPEIMERNLKIEAEIDKRIEKTIARLVGIKEFKKLYGTKEITASSTEVVSLPAKRSGKT